MDEIEEVEEQVRTLNYKLTVIKKELELIVDDYKACQETNVVDIVQELNTVLVEYF